MRHMKRMTVLLITAAFLILMPANALAAAKEYVPTEATYYELKGGKWEEISKETFSYTKNGRIKLHTSEIIQSGFSVRTAYTWKGNFLKKQESQYNATTYSYKKKKLNYLTEVKKSSGKTTISSISWKKRKGTFTSSNGTTGSYTVNKRNQVINYTLVDSYGAKYTTSLKYYGNGNLKSESHSEPFYSYVKKYNKKGYPISSKSNISEETYTYKRNKKGQITEQLITSKGTGGGVDYYKKVFSKWKKISRSVRNCDAFGNYVRTPYY